MSNHNSCRVLFDKIASVYFKDKFVFLHWKWPSDGTNTVPIVPAYCRSLLVWNWHTGVNVPHAPARQISVLTIVFLCLFWKITFVCNWCKLLQATDVFRVAETTASINWDNCTNFAKAQKPTCDKCFQCGLCGSGVMLQRTPQNGQCKLHNFRFFVQGGPNLAIGLPRSWQCLRRSTCRDEIVLSTKFGTVPEESAVIFSSMLRYDPVSVWLCAYHMLVFCRNGWTDQAGFHHRSFLSTYSTLRCKEIPVSP